VVVSNGFDRICRPYSIIREFETHISAGNKYDSLGIVCELDIVKMWGEIIG